MTNWVFQPTTQSSSHDSRDTTTDTQNFSLTPTGSARDESQPTQNYNTSLFSYIDPLENVLSTTNQGLNHSLLITPTTSENLEKCFADETQKVPAEESTRIENSSASLSKPYFVQLSENTETTLGVYQITKAGLEAFPEHTYEYFVKATITSSYSLHDIGILLNIDPNFLRQLNPHLQSYSFNTGTEIYVPLRKEDIDQGYVVLHEGDTSYFYESVFPGLDSSQLPNPWLERTIAFGSGAMTLNLTPWEDQTTAKLLEETLVDASPRVDEHSYYYQSGGMEYVRTTNQTNHLELAGATFTGGVTLLSLGSLARNVIMRKSPKLAAQIFSVQSFSKVFGDTLAKFFIAYMESGAGRQAIMQGLVFFFESPEYAAKAYHWLMNDRQKFKDAVKSRFNNLSPEEGLAVGLLGVFGLATLRFAPRQLQKKGFNLIDDIDRFEDAIEFFADTCFRIGLVYTGYEGHVATEQRQQLEKHENTPEILALKEENLEEWIGVSAFASILMIFPNAAEGIGHGGSYIAQSAGFTAETGSLAGKIACIFDDLPVPVDMALSLWYYFFPDELGDRQIVSKAHKDM